MTGVTRERQGVAAANARGRIFIGTHHIGLERLAAGMALAPVSAMSDFRRLFPMFALAAALLMALNARAQTMTSREDLQQAAESFLRSRLGTSGAEALFVDAAGIDPRLRLASCTTRLEAFLPPGAQPAARTTVGVRCAAPYWTVYIPVSIETQMQVLVVKQARPRLAALSSADVVTEARRVPGFPTSYVTDAAFLKGRHLRMAAAPGTALKADMLATDTLIRRGQRVTLLSAAGSIEVRAPGEAMSDALPDGRVRVQNLASRRIVEGIAETADSVRVGP